MKGSELVEWEHTDMQKAYALAYMYILTRKNSKQKSRKIHLISIKMPKIRVKHLFGKELAQVGENRTSF